MEDRWSGAISIARGLGDGGRRPCLEVEEDYAAIAQRNLEDAGVAARVEIIVRPALELMRAMQAQPTFDYVLRDPDKTRTTRGDLAAPAAGRRAPEDNVLLGGRVTDPQDERASGWSMR